MFLPDYQSRIVDRLFDSPDLYVLMVDEEKEAALVVRMTRETYSSSTFLDWRTERAGEEAELVPVRSIEQAFAEREIVPRPLRFIIHPAFAGSTLLCRCLDHAGVCLPYKEPYLLFQIATNRRYRQIGEKPDDGLVSLDWTLALLSRSYDPAEEVVIKPGDSCINIARDIIGHNPGSTAVLLGMSLEDFVVSNLKRPDRIEFLRGNVSRTQVDLDAMELGPEDDPERLADGAAAAYVWFGLMAHYLDILDDEGLRARSLDSAAFYGDPHGTLRALADFFELSLTGAHIEDAVAKNVFVRDSKDPSMTYDASVRAAAEARSRSQLAKELDDAREWIEKHAQTFPIPTRLPRPLLEGSS